jgi:hypothetical protein
LPGKVPHLTEEVLSLAVDDYPPTRHGRPRLVASENWRIHRRSLIQQVGQAGIIDRPG